LDACNLAPFPERAKHKLAFANIISRSLQRSNDVFSAELRFMMSIPKFRIIIFICNYNGGFAMAVAAETDRAFRKAMRRFAAAVSAISARQGAERHAMAATAVSSPSMALPSLPACLYSRSRFHRVLNAQKPFCANILHRDRAAPSRDFSQPVAPEERRRIGWVDGGAFSYIGGTQAAVQMQEGAADSVRNAYGLHRRRDGRHRPCRRRAAHLPERAIRAPCAAGATADRHRFILLATIEYRPYSGPN
jgi:hypothetical protein